MATKYVYSGASGSNDGSSWANAWTSLASSTGVSAGDDVLVAHNHALLSGSDISLTWSNGTVTNPVRILCANSGTGALATGAVIATASANLSLNGHIMSHGITWKTGRSLNVGQATNYHQVWMSTTFALEATSATLAASLVWGFAGGDQGTCVLLNCTVDKSLGTNDGGQSMVTTGASSGRVYAKNLTIGAGTTGNVIGGTTSSRFAEVVIEDSDLSAIATVFRYSGSNDSGRYIIRRCKLHSSWAVAGTVSNPTVQVLIEGCIAGSISVPPTGLTYWARYYGTVLGSLSRYRTGGADDGANANAHSWEMTTNANALEIYRPLESPPIARWVEPDASISGATAKGIFTSTRCAPLATPAALTTDSGSTWNGSGVGTKQKIDHVLTNGQTLTVYVASGGTLNNDDFWIEVSEPDQVGGPVVVRCFLAKPSTTVYVDPKLEVA